MRVGSGLDNEQVEGRRTWPSLAALSLALWVATFVGLLSDAPTFSASCNTQGELRSHSSIITDSIRGSGGNYGSKISASPGTEDNGSEQSQQTVSFPKVAWLMSFPNSGTSYTLRIVRQITNRTTASNYGHEHLINISSGRIDTNDDADDGDEIHHFSKHDNAANASRSGISVLLNSNWTQGPYRANLSQTLPEHYILTKTHCGSRCVHCAPDGYLETLRTFQRACLMGRRINYNSNDNQTSTTMTTTITTNTMYEPTIVGRAVHLIRHPLDNIVARFHLSRRRDHDNQNVYYPNNATGFQAWCHSLDRRYWQYETHTPWLDGALLKLFEHVPCHAEFFKYIQWHNLAYLTTTTMMDIPVHVLRYEDYYDPSDGSNRNRNWRRSVESLLHFLDLPAVAWTDATPFDMHTYHHDYYYTNEQVSGISALLQQIAAAPVWKTLVGPYFVSDLE